MGRKMRRKLTNQEFYEQVYRQQLVAETLMVVKKLAEFQLFMLCHEDLDEDFCNECFSDRECREKAIDIAATLTEIEMQSIALDALATNRMLMQKASELIDSGSTTIYM